MSERAPGCHFPARRRARSPIRTAGLFFYSPCARQCLDTADRLTVRNWPNRSMVMTSGCVPGGRWFDPRQKQLFIFTAAGRPARPEGVIKKSGRTGDRTRDPPFASRTVRHYATARPNASARPPGYLRRPNGSVRGPIAQAGAPLGPRPYKFPQGLLLRNCAKQACSPGSQLFLVMLDTGGFNCR